MGVWSPTAGGWNQRNIARREAEHAQRAVDTRRRIEGQALVAIHEVIVLYGYAAIDELVAEKKAQLRDRVDPAVGQKTT